MSARLHRPLAGGRGPGRRHGRGHGCRAGRGHGRRPGRGLSERGQATVELVGLMPLVAAVVLAAFTGVAAFAAHEQAGAAAEAGAVALLQDRDPSTAARHALPEAARGRSRIRISGRRVTVSVRPRVPLLARRLQATVTADAGAEAGP